MSFVRQYCLAMLIGYSMGLPTLNISLFLHHLCISPDLKMKRSRKTKIGVNIPCGTSNWCASFQLKMLKVKVTVRVRVAV